MGSPQYLRAIPHSTDKKALEALDATLQALPMGGGCLVRHDDGEVLVHADGSVAVSCGSARFTGYAIEKQNYVKEVITDEST